MGAGAIHRWLSGLFVLVLAMSLNVAQAGTQVSYVHTDHLGTPKAITDIRQDVIWQASHRPFGEAEIIVGGPDQMNLRFPGQYFDEETGLHYNYFRDYDPSIGRYIESDPIGLDGGMNAYVYVQGNPLRFIDPRGQDVIPAPGDGESIALDPVSEAGICGILLATCFLDGPQLGPADFVCSSALSAMCMRMVPLDEIEEIPVFPLFPDDESTSACPVENTPDNLESSRDLLRERLKFQTAR